MVGGHRHRLARSRRRRERRRRNWASRRPTGSYEELLADKDVDAIYNPLPNHLHVPWTIKAAEHGKHVLCEKPIALSADEARQLMAVRDRTGAKIQEAFMVRTHPQWLTVKDLVLERPHRRGAIDPRRVQLHQSRPGEHPQPARTSAAAR